MGLQHVKKHMYRIGECCFLQIVHFYFLEILLFDISVTRNLKVENEEQLLRPKTAVEILLNKKGQDEGCRLRWITCTDSRWIMLYGGSYMHKLSSVV